MKKIDFDKTNDIQNAKPSFSYVPQLEWPSKRDDEIEGQHFNLNQLLFDIEENGNELLFDYQIIIYSELTE